MSSPIKTKQAAAVISSHHTEVLIQHYSDRLFILISQLSGKVGALYDISPAASTGPPSIRRHTLNGLSLPVPDQAAKVTCLMGSAKNETMADLHALYAAQIGALCEGPVVLCLGLRDSGERGMQGDRETFAEAMKLVVECL